MPTEVLPPSGDPPALLKLGNLDLTTYARLYGDAGFDVYDSSGFLEPQFNTSPLASGQPLVSVTETNREMAWPLYLNDSTKDLLHELVRQINQEIRNTRPLRVEWQDNGATDSTFYDVAYARFDPDFKFPQARAGWLAGTLRVWCAPPYGHTATERVVGTSLASGPLVRLSCASIEGDVPALPKVMVSFPSAIVDDHVLAVTVPPSGSYAIRVPAASLSLAGGATLVGATAYAGAQYVQQNINNDGIPDPVCSFSLSVPAAYGGRNRILALLERSGTGTVTAAMNTAGAMPGAPSAWLRAATVTIGPNSGLGLYDLGVFSVPTDIPVGGLSTSIYRLRLDGNAVASAKLNVNEIYLMPEDQTVLVTARDHGPVPVLDVFDATINRSYGLCGGTSGQAVGLEGTQRGLIPPLPCATAPEVAVLQSRLPYNPGDILGSDLQFPTAQTNIFSVEVRARERFSFAR